MSAPSPRADGPRMTVEEFLQLPDEDPYRLELVRGKVVREPPPGGRHGQVATVLAAALHQYASAHGLGTVLVETGYVLSRVTDTVRGPDLSFVSTRRTAHGPLPESALEGAPDLAVEILSPSNRAGEMMEEVADYLEAGCSAVWVVDARRRCVTVHEPGRPPTSLHEPDVLEGGRVLSGFRIPVADLFAG